LNTDTNLISKIKKLFEKLTDAQNLSQSFHLV